MVKNKQIPAIRFKNFEEEWEEIELGEIGETFTGLSGKTKNDFGHGEGRFVTYMNVFSNTISDTDQTEPVEVDDSQNSVKTGDVFFTTSSETPEEVGMSSVWLGKNENIYLNSFCFGYRLNLKLDYYYLAYMLRSSSFRKKITFFAQGISRYNISKNKVMGISVSIPRYTEQTEIGNYFRGLDTLLLLQVQKLKKASCLKKAMLEKMFCKGTADVPEIRFQGFTGKWERKKLGEIFNFDIPTNSLSRAFLNDENGEIKNIHYGDILIKYNSCISVTGQNIPYISNGNLSDFKNCFLKDGDIIFADAAEDETVGKAVEIRDINENYVVSGLHTIAARPVFKFQKYYLGYLLNSEAYHNQLISFMQGTKVLSISKTNLKKTTLAYPSTEIEQQRIGQYFYNLDKLIAQSTQKIQQLQRLKQALLQKMFI